VSNLEQHPISSADNLLLKGAMEPWKRWERRAIQTLRPVCGKNILYVCRSCLAHSGWTLGISSHFFLTTTLITVVVLDPLIALGHEVKREPLPWHFVDLHSERVALPTLRRPVVQVQKNLIVARLTAAFNASPTKTRCLLGSVCRLPCLTS
jgi:hypothetical protein